MDISSGKHQGKTSQMVVLNHPDYVVWYIHELPNAKLSAAFDQHIKKMDARAFTAKCFHCKGQAARATAYEGDPGLMFWCDTCNPYGAGAVQGKLRLIRTFSDAVRHINATADGHKAFMKEIVRGLAEGKGLPKRVGESQAAAFFA